MDLHNKMCDDLREMCTKCVNMFYAKKSRMPTLKETLKILLELAPDDEIKKIFLEYIPLVYKIEICSRIANGEISDFPKSQPKKPKEYKPSAIVEEYLQSVIDNRSDAPVSQ